MLNLTGPQWFQVVVYSLLVIFWLSVFIFTIATRNLQVSSPSSRIYRRAHLAFLFVAGVLSVDSAYWALANISKIGIITKEVDTFLRQPLYVALVKSAVLLSSLAFLWIVLRLGKDVRSRIAGTYFHGLIDQTWDAIGILDKRGVMLIWNTGAERLFGFSRDFAQGRHINNFLVPNDEELRETTWQLLRRAKGEKRAVRYTQPRLKNTGETIMVEIVSSPIFDEDGRFEGYFGIMRPALQQDEARTAP